MARRFFGAGLVFAALVAGCPGPTFIVQQYAGPARPAETIATLRINGADSVRVLTLDGEDISAPIESDARLHIELLPARHELTVGDAKNPTARFPRLSFDAQAGKFYRVKLAPDPGGSVAVDAHVYEVTRGSDEAVRDVTLAAPSAPVRPPRPRPVAPPPPAEEDAGSAEPGEDGAAEDPL